MLDESNNVSSQEAVSTARQAASRANGATSRGPNTEEGKAVSRRNSFKHGSTASTLLLDESIGGEHLREVKALLAADHEPKTVAQKIAFARLAVALVAERRSNDMELRTLIHGLAFESSGADRQMRYISMQSKRLQQALANWKEAFDDETPVAREDDPENNSRGSSL